MKATQGEKLKILIPEQMLQRLPIALAQVKADNISESLPTVIRQVISSLYQEKQITKKYNEFNKRYSTKMDTVFMNSTNSKTSDPQRLFLNSRDRIKLKRSDN